MEKVNVSAYSLSHLGINEYAYFEEDSLLIIEEAFKENRLVLGGDVYFLENNKIHRTLDSWYYEGNSSKSSMEKAREYITNYSRRNRGEFLYSIVLGE